MAHPSLPGVAPGTLPGAVARPADPRALGALLVAEALLAFAPLLVLGPAIGWPASLGRPAAEQLTAIAAEHDAVRLGYGLYLLYSVLVAPVMIGLAAHAFGTLARPLAATVAAFAALSALARSIGILRWLTVMPALASAHAAGGVDGRADVERLFTAISLYGGGIGELLGVALFMALSVGALGFGALRGGTLPKGLAAAGVACALLLGALCLPALGLPAVVPVAGAVTALSLWMLVAGLWLLRQRPAG